MSGIHNNLYATGPFPSYEAPVDAEEPIPADVGAYDHEAFEEGLANYQIGNERIEQILAALEALRANDANWNEGEGYEQGNYYEEGYYYPEGNYYYEEGYHPEGNYYEEGYHPEGNYYEEGNYPPESNSHLEGKDYDAPAEETPATAPLPLDAPITQAEIDAVLAEAAAFEPEEPGVLAQNEPLQADTPAVLEEAPAVSKLFEPLGTWKATSYPDISLEYTRHVPEKIREQKREELTNLLGAELAARVVKEEPKAEVSAHPPVTKSAAQIVIEEEDEGEEILLFEGATNVSMENFSAPKPAPVVPAPVLKQPVEFNLMSFEPVMAHSPVQQTAQKVAGASRQDLLTSFNFPNQAVTEIEAPKGSLYPSLEERRVAPIQQPPVQTATQAVRASKPLVATIPSKEPQAVGASQIPQPTSASKTAQPKSANRLQSKPSHKESVNPFALDSGFRPLFVKMDHEMNVLAYSIHKEIDAGRYAEFNPHIPTKSLNPYLLDIARTARIDTNVGRRRKVNYMHPLPLRYAQQPVQGGPTPAAETQAIVNAVFSEVVARYFREYRV